jgi:AcrR family transcriptional regulator
VRLQKIDVSRTGSAVWPSGARFWGGPMAEMQSRGEIRNYKLQKVAANLFLKHGYDGVTIDRIVEMAGGSKSTVYSEFAGKCGLFIKSIENLCRESNESLTQIDYQGLDLEQSLKKLAFHILKLITSKRSVELHRLAIGEAANCPEVGEAWYTHGPARTASFIMAVLERHRGELRHTTAYLERIAVMLHDSLTGDILYRHLAGISKHESDADLQRTAKTVVEVVLAAIH